MILQYVDLLLITHCDKREDYYKSSMNMKKDHYAYLVVAKAEERQVWKTLKSAALDLDKFISRESEEPQIRHTG